MTIIFPIVQIALAVYFLVGAIGGKNKIFDPRFVKDGKEKVYKKVMRIMFGVTGGLMIALGTVICQAVLHPWNWKGLWDPAAGLLLISLGSMAVGFADDWIKAVKKRHEGLTPWQKIAGQVIVAAAFTCWCYFHPQIINFIITCFYPDAIQFQEGEHDIYSDSLITINKSMI